SATIQRSSTVTLGKRREGSILAIRPRVADDFEPARLPVATAVTGRDVALDPGVAKAPDHLPRAEIHVGVVAAHDPVASPLQLRDDRWRNAGFHLQIQAG